jgi:hypothetical protein
VHIDLAPALKIGNQRTSSRNYGSNIKSLPANEMEGFCTLDPLRTCYRRVDGRYVTKDTVTRDREAILKFSRRCLIVLPFIYLDTTVSARTRLIMTTLATELLALALNMPIVEIFELNKS